MNLFSSLEIEAHRSDQEQRPGKTEPRFRMRIVTGNIEENQAEREIEKIFMFVMAAAHLLILCETGEYARRAGNYLKHRRNL